MKNHNLKMLLTGLVMLLGLFILSCGDDEESPFTPEDENQIDWQNARSITVTVSPDDSDIRRASLSFITEDNASLLCGQSTGYEARYLLRFGLKDKPRGMVSMDGAFLMLTPDYESEPSGIDLLVSPLIVGFDDNNVTWAECENDKDWDTPGGDFEAGTSVGFKAQALAFYSTSTIIVVDILPLVQKWTDGELNNRGLIIYPAPSSAAGLKGFTRLTAKLAIRYTVEETNPDTQQIQTKIIDVDQSLDREAYIIFRPTPPDTGKSVLSVGGFLGAEDLTLWRFSVPEVPPQATVNQAILKLRRIGAESPETPSLDTDLTVSVYRVREDWREESETRDISISIEEESSEVSLGDAGFIELNISDLIRRWRKNPDDNYGLALRIDENRDEQRASHLFGGPAADNELRPTLDIIYTPAPEVQP